MKTLTSNADSAALISSVKPADSTGQPTAAEHSGDLLNPVTARIPIIENPFTDFVGRCFFHLGLWVERYMSWRQRVPAGDTRSYRNFAELLKTEVGSASLKPSDSPAVLVPTTSEVVASTLPPLQPAASGPAAALDSSTDLLLK